MRRWLVQYGALAAAGLCIIAPFCAYGQGGPPMITDDPGTPGNGKWEINLAAAFQHRVGETAYDAPAVDLNYGLGETIQLTLQGRPALMKRSGHGLVAGLGGTEAAVKWRFVDEEKRGFDVSMFPRVIFNIVPSSVRRGLSDDGTRFQVPFQASRRFGRFRLDVEFGARAGTVGRGEWLYGLVGGFDLNKTTAVMAEMQGSARTNFSGDVLTANLGIRRSLSSRRILIASLGHELRDQDQARAFIGYVGVQLLY